jgi:NitT/TauT family transport system permease protein
MIQFTPQIQSTSLPSMDTPPRRRDTGTAGLLRKVLAHPLGINAARTLVLILLFIVWQIASDMLVLKFFISDPTSILGEIAKWIGSGALWNHLGISMLTLLLGYVFGATAGVVVGFTLGVLPRVERTIAPFVASIYGLPKIALLPLFVIFLGIGIESKIALVAIVVFFLLLYSTMDGARDVDPDIMASLQLMGATRMELLFKVLLPAALPWVYTGLRVSVGYALTTTVMGEVLFSNRGLGFLIESSAARFNTAGVFAAIFILVGLSLIITAVLTRMENHSTRWRV